MDSINTEAFASKEALNYWKDVDLYIGGSEHATGHLLYSRFWQKFLFDKGVVPVDEYAKKLINQGMILGTSAFVYRLDLGSFGFDAKGADIKEQLNKFIVFISLDRLNFLKKSSDETIKFNNYIRNEFQKVNLEKGKLVHVNVDLNKIHPIHVKVKYVNASDELDIEGLRSDEEFGKDYENAIFIGGKGGIIKGDNDVFKVGRDV